ncbi:antibiotic biosynthesis monooxygenase family protein [Streptomyces flaveolus]|uniref:antibiotic biosynthesis monooxygenase family protein n=1 Tax=Streptomyces flaveolus TaxID=67297 RepID=UPI0033E8AC72
MITEVARIDVRPGSEEAFEQAVAEAIPVFLDAAGCRGIALHRVVEHPRRYRLVVCWESVEHHTVTFRASGGFRQWRALAGPHFATPPEVEHTYTVLSG